MCLARLVEQAALIDYLDCLIAKPCGHFESDDECVQAAGTSDAERDEFIARCTAQLATCGQSAGICDVGLPLVRKEWMRAYDDCLDLPCAELDSCIDRVGLDTASSECLRLGADAGNAMSR
jgi:hypothetical protein